MLVFEERGKPLRAEKRTNKLNPHMMPSLGIDPGSHWWEASALTTTPPLLPKYILACKILYFRLQNAATVYAQQSDNIVKYILSVF